MLKLCIRSTTTGQLPLSTGTARTEAYEDIPILTKLRDDAQCTPKREIGLIITGSGRELPNPHNDNLTDNHFPEQ
jgi:hypothetical protein